MAPDSKGTETTLRPGSLQAYQREAATLRQHTAPRRHIAAIVRHAVLIAVALPFVIPFYWLLISAFKTRGDLLTLPPT